MSYRILHCGKPLANYYLCVEHKVAGFVIRGPESGDKVFPTYTPSVAVDELVCLSYVTNRGIVLDCWCVSYSS